MNQKNKNGIWLHQKEQVQTGGGGWMLSLLLSVVTVVISALMLLELTGTSDFSETKILILAGVIVCVCHAIAIKLQRQKIFYPVILCFLLALVLIFRKQLLTGFCMFWNQMGDTWTASTGVVLTELSTGIGENSGCLVLFSIFAGVILAVMCCWLISWKVPVIAVLLPGIFLVGMIVFGQTVILPWTMLVLIVAIFLLLCAGCKDKNNSFRDLAGRLFLPIVACVVLLLITSATGIENWAVKMGDNVRATVHEKRFETEHTTLPEGKFGGEDTSAGGTALIVNMETPQDLYLRGFTGAVFADDTWSELDGSILAENEDLLYWLNQNGFNPNVQFATALQADEKDTLVTIQNVGACSRYMYVPFNLGTKDVLVPERISSDSVIVDGEKEYTFAVAAADSELLAAGLDGLASSDEDTVQFLQAESAYREFVYENYLQIPENVTEMLSKAWDEQASMYGNVEDLTSIQAQECALRFLKECYPEEGGQADMELPLDVAKGTAFQRSTVTAMTLRYFGIPARYVEGYIVTEDMAKAAEDHTAIQVGSDCATSWVEVYQDGVGWIPMNLTPGLEALKQNPDEQLEENDEPLPEEGEELEEEPDNTMEEPEPDGGYSVTVAQKMSFKILLPIAIILLVLLFFFIRRKMILKGKQKRFCAEDRNDAVAWIFADSMLLLGKMGFQRGNGSVWDLHTPVEQRFGETYATAFAEMIDLNGRAMFSSREVEAVHWEQAMAFRASTIEQLKSSARWYQKIWMQWVLCLY